MSFENKGSISATVYVTRDPDRSGNYPCTGTADDVPIQLALDEVSRRGGGKVVLGEGVYDITADLTPDSDTIIEGMGIETVLTGSGGSIVSAVIEVNTKTNVIVRDLKIDGGGAGVATRGLRFVDSDDCWAEQLWVTNAANNNVEVRRGNRVQLHRIVSWSAVANNGINITGTDGDRCTNILVSNCILYTNDDEGIYCNWTNDSLIEGNFCYSNGNNGIYFYTGNLRNTIKNNWCYDHTALSPSGQGIFVNWDNSNPIDYFIVEGNTTYGNRVGIRLFGVNFFSVNDNYCVDTARGINVDTSIADGVVDGNFCDGGTNNIMVVDTCLRTVVSNNVVCNATGASSGLLLSSSDQLVVEGNILYNNAEYGIEMSVGNTYCTLTGNLLQDNTLDGIYISGNHHVLTGNMAYSNTSDGYFLTGADNCLLTGNAAFDNGAYGFLVDAASIENEFQANYTRANTTACFRINNANCVRNIIRDNSFDEGNISDVGGGHNCVAYLNYDPSAGTFIVTINPPAVVGGGGGVLP